VKNVVAATLVLNELLFLPQGIIDAHDSKMRE
jgi:hypothetical protein